MINKTLTLEIKKEPAEGRPYRMATLMAGTQTVSIDLATYDSPYERLLLLTEKIISGVNGLDSFSYNPEGSVDVEFRTNPINNLKNIYFYVGYTDGLHQVEGIFDRHQLAQELLKLCDDPYPLDTDIEKVEIDLQKLRALL